MGDNTFGLGLFERVLIVIIIGIIVGGIVSLVAGGIAGGAVGLFIFGVFASVGFISWWLLWPSLIAGLIIVIKGGNR